MGKDIYGKLRGSDIPVVKKVIETFKDHSLHVGLHGTSLWNPKYKDVDLLVTSDTNDVQSFEDAIQVLVGKEGTKIGKRRGNEEIGLDLDIIIENVELHISFVQLL